MNSLEANIRDNSTKGQLNAIRNNGNVPAIIYGGKDQNQKITISKKLLKVLIEKENFLSNIITLNVDGKPQNVLPREVKYHILTLFHGYLNLSFYFLTMKTHMNILKINFY